MKEEAAVSAKDSLAAALKGEAPAEAGEQNRKNYPLLSVLQLNQSGVGAIVGYADYKDTADINRILNMKEVKEVLPRDLKLMWGVELLIWIRPDVFSNCMQSNLPSATDVRRWKVM